LGAPGLLSSALPRLGAITQGNRGCRLLRSLEPHRGAGRGEDPSGLPARRGSPPASRRARSPAHPGQLRVGQEAAAQPDPGRLARNARPHATAQEPLPLVAGAYPAPPRRGHPSRYRRVRRLPPRASGRQAGCLHLRRARHAPRGSRRSPPRHRSHRRRRPQASGSPQAQGGRPRARRGRRHRRLSPTRCPSPPWLHRVTRRWAWRIAHTTRPIEGREPRPIAEREREHHVQRLVQDALDEVRRAEVRAVADDPQGRRQLKHTRYALLKNPWNLSAIEDAKLTTLPKTNATLYRAYLMKESFTAILDRRQQHVVRKKLEEWTSWAMHSGLKPFAKVARTVRQHLDGIVAYVATGLSNARSEGTNGKVRTITRRSYGLHSASALIALIHLCCSGLTLQPAQTTPPFHQT